MAKELTLDELEREFRRYQKMKAHTDGGVEPRTLLNLAWYAGEQRAFLRGTRLVTPPRDRNKPQMVVNILKKRFDKVIGKLSGIDPVFKSHPDTDDPEDISESDVVDNLDRALDEKVREVALRRRRWFWMGMGGSAFEFTEHVPDETVEPVPVTDPKTGEVIWKDNLTGDSVRESLRDQIIEAGLGPPERFEPLEELQLTGDIKSTIEGPLTMFAPDSMVDISDLASDQSIMRARIKSRAWIESNYPDFDFGETSTQTEFKIVTTDISHAGDSLSGTNLKHLIPIIQGTKSKDDPDMFMILDRYQPVSADLPRGWSNSDTPELAWGGRLTTFIPSVGIVHDGELPYEDGIPIRIFHWDAVTTTTWTGGLVEHAIPVQKSFNKHQTNLNAIGNAYIKMKLLATTGFDLDKWDPDTTHPIVGGLDDSGQPLLAFLDPPRVPPWYMTRTENLSELITEMMGGGDLFDKPKFPGALRGSMAIPILLEMGDSEYKPILEEYGIVLAEVKQQRINRVKQFWPAVRTMHYFSRRGRQEVFSFHTSAILRAGTNYNISVVRTSLVPELASMREARIAARLSGPLQVLYTDERSGGFDKEAIAADLRFGPAARESKIAADRMFAKQVIARVLKAQPAPPVLPMQPHAIMLDEYEGVINTLDFFRLSPQVQQGLTDRSEAHLGFLEKAAQAQSDAAQAQATQAAAADAAQQAAARAGAEAVDAVRDQLRVSFEQMTATLMQQGPENFVDPRSPTPGEQAPL